MQADAQRDRWANEFAQQPDQWANDFERTQTGATASISGQGQTDAKSQQDTRALADFLGKDANPKMKNSKFLQFISKMSRGEIILEDNQVLYVWLFSHALPCAVKAWPLFASTGVCATACSASTACINASVCQ